MITIYHNPRCRKSREGLLILENSGKNFKIIKYLENLLSKEELEEILIKLEIEPIDLVRKSEKIWKEQFKGKELSKDDIVDAMVNHPKLIERPIVINNEEAVIGRPSSKILEIL